MDWLNYHHLLYFHTVVQQGSISAAAEKLMLTQPTLSKQLKQLEDSLGIPLLEKKGRNLSPTKAGQIANQYAEDIFRLGREMKNTLQGQIPQRPKTLRVGTLDHLAKSVIQQLLTPALIHFPDLRLVCQEGKYSELNKLLVQGELDMVLTDHLPSHTLPITSIPLGESPVAIFCSPELAQSSSQSFPDCLQDFPWILPWRGSYLRRQLDGWFNKNEMNINVALEAEDGALVNYMAQKGLGVFAAPSNISAEIVSQFQLKELGILKGVNEKVYLLTPKQKMENPVIKMILTEAKKFWKNQ